MIKKSKFKKNLIFRCFSLKGNVGNKFIKTIKIFVFFALIFIYTFQVAEMTKSIHKVQVYNREIASIHEKSRKAEYSFLKSNSVSRANELIDLYGFVRAENVYYINLPELEVASR